MNCEPPPPSPLKKSESIILILPFRSNDPQKNLHFDSSQKNQKVSKNQKITDSAKYIHPKQFHSQIHILKIRKNPRLFPKIPKSLPTPKKSGKIRKKMQEKSGKTNWKQHYSNVILSQSPNNGEINIV